MSRIFSGGQDVIRASRARFFALEVSEDGARIHTQVTRGAGAVAAVEAEHFIDVLALPALACLGQGEDGRQLVGVDAEVVGAEQGLVSQHQRLLDSVLHLANVSRPVVALDRGDRAGGEPAHLAGQLLRVARQQVARQHHHVITAIAQRRQVQVHDVEPVV